MDKSFIFSTILAEPKSYENPFIVRRPISKQDSEVNILLRAFRGVHKTVL
jgi:hypothetical protein